LLIDHPRRGAVLELATLALVNGRPVVVFAVVTFDEDLAIVSTPVKKRQALEMNLLKALGVMPRFSSIPWSV